MTDIDEARPTPQPLKQYLAFFDNNRAIGVADMSTTGFEFYNKPWLHDAITGMMFNTVQATTCDMVSARHVEEFKYVHEFRMSQPGYSHDD